MKKLYSVFSAFQRGEPRPIRYRAEPLRTSGPSVPKPMVELYQDFGWTLVDEVQDSFLLFSSQDPDAPEPHSDPQLQGELWRKLYKVKRRRFWYYPLNIIGINILSWMNFSMSATPMSVSLLVTAPIKIILWTFAIIYIALGWADLRRMSQVIRRLEAGEPLESQTAVSPPRRLNLVMFCACLASLVLLAAVLLGNFVGRQTRPLEELSDFPLLSLARLEGEGYTPRSLLIPKGIDPETHRPILQDYGSCFRRYWYPPASFQWYVSQYGNTSQGDRASLDIDRYGLNVPFFSSFAARELLDRAMEWSLDREPERRPDSWTVEEIPREDVSLLILAWREDGFQLAAAAAGNSALLVRYTGSQELAEHLDEIAAMVK